MASIDYQEAKQEIKSIFCNNISGFRKIVFWYDAPQNFKEDIINDTFDFCKLLICDKNEFAIKKILEHEDASSDYLIYVASERPIDIENWLLDILMYSDEYYADTVALTMRRLGLINHDLRKIIERYSKFFDNDNRSKKLTSYVSINDAMSGDDLKMAMMAVIVKASTRSIESVLTELVFEDSVNTKYGELLKFGFDEYFWDTISQAYNYEGDQKLEVLTKKFMFTAMMEQRTTLDNLPSFYKQFIIENSGKMDAKFFIERIKKDDRYKPFQLSLAIDMKVEELIKARDIVCVEYSDIFECIDNNIIEKVAESLMNGSLDYDIFERVISKRINSVWYKEHSSKYEMLLATIAFYRLIDKPIKSGCTAVAYMKDYAENYYRIDFYYRQVCTCYKQIDNPIEAIEGLSDRVELSYQDKFLGVIGKNFSEALSKQSDWSFIGVQNSSSFYQMIQRRPFKKLFVIISDALRYEVGHEIYDKIKTDPILKGSVDIDYAISPLPSETRFGMAALLPHNQINYQNNNVFIDGEPTNSVNARNKILQAKNNSYAAVSYETINGYSRNELREYMSDKTLIYIYHNVIDKTGEHNEGKVFDVVKSAIDEILVLIKKLYNNLQISNYYITADHGFFYRKNTIEESQKYSNVVTLKPIEASKRYVITDDSSMKIPYTTEFDLGEYNAEHRVITPFAYDLFKTQGSGLQYVHGGASLQEIMIPIIHISELRSKKLVDTIRPVGVRLKSITRKISNRSFTLDFEQYEKVEDKKQPLTCETFFVDELGNKVSGEYKFIANSSSDDVLTRVTKIRFTLKNIEFDRNNRYFLILRNTEKTNEFIEKEQFTFDILGFKPF